MKNIHHTALKVDKTLSVSDYVLSKGCEALNDAT